MRFLKYLDIRNFSRNNKYYFLFNLVLGLATLIGFVLTRDTPVQQSLINALFDQAIEWRTGLLKFGRECDAEIAAKDIVILSFNDTDMKEWRYPIMTPRNKMADMIRFAYEGGASVIVLDMELAEPDYSPAKKILGDSKAMTGQERDKELFDLLERIKNDTASNTRVLISGDLHADKTLKENDFARLIDNKKIYAASTYVSASRGNDRTVRFWQPYVEITAEYDEVESREVLWSFQILSLALTEGGEEDLERISQNILHGNDEKFTLHCNSGREFIFYREIESSTGMVLRNTQSLQYNRIQYVFKPFSLEKKMHNISTENEGHWSDHEYLDFKNKIVLIGREDKECNDFIATPIGRMPGLYVHGNAIATILGNTPPHISPLWKYLVIEIILIIVTAYIFVYRQYSGAKRISGIMAIICQGGVYIYFWFTNEFVYLTCSFASIGVYNFVSRMEEWFKRGLSIKGYFNKIFKKKSDKASGDLKK